jgi:hypothetical protein
MSIILAASAKEISTERGNPLTRKLLFFLIAILGFFVAVPTQGQPRKSVYTSLDAKQCRKLKSSNSEGGDYLGRCPGTAGYMLLVSEGDLRQNIEVVTPQGRKHSLELWSVVSPAFSSLGPKAEWRMSKSKPVALIVRYNASENPEKPDKTTSYLVVTKITPNEICVTDKLSPGPTANEDARRLADEAATKPCLKSP